MDHLFLDQDGIPTIVEVKRQSDTRIRREVVGQMLDYAANGVAYWPVEEIRTLFETNCAPRGLDSTEELTRLLGPDVSTVDFWVKVKTNLQAGKIRMLFVADLIPPELRKIVEFLNKQMDPAEVLALELSQYEGEGNLKTLVPRLYGQTEEAQQKKGISGEKRNWDEKSIYEDMERRVGSKSVEVAKKIASWMKDNADQVLFGQGKVDGSMFTTFIRNGVRFAPLQFNSNGRLSINFGYCLKAPFDDVKRRLEWLERLNNAGGVNLQQSANDKFSSLPLTIFVDEQRLTKFLGAMDWFVSELRKPETQEAQV